MLLLSLCSIFFCLLYLLFESFFTSALADGLSLEFEWQQVSSNIQDSSEYSGRSQQCCSLDGGLLSSSKSSSPFNNPLVTVPKAPITIGIMVTFMFHGFFFSIPLQGRVIYPSFHFLSVLFCHQPGQQSPQQPSAPYTIGITVTLMLHRFFQFCCKVQVLIFLISFSFTLWSAWTANSQFGSFSFLFNDYDYVRLSGRNLGICLYFKIPENLCVAYTRTDSDLCIYHLVEWSNFNFLPSSSGSPFSPIRV